MSDIVNKQQKGIPPDGGWGWMVAAGAFMCTMMISLPAITFGVLLNDIIFAMGTTTATATWTMSILLGISGLISPLVTIAIDIFSCRKTAIFGGLVMSVGLMLSSYARDITTLYITFGIFGAIGFGCNRVVAIVILGQYFKKRYGISAGFMMAGFSTSRLLFSTIILFTKMTYGFRGAYLIMGATCLHICVGAALYQPPKWHYLRTPCEAEAGSPEEKKPFEITTIIKDPAIAPLKLQRKDIADSKPQLDVVTLSHHVLIVPITDKSAKNSSEKQQDIEKILSSEEPSMNFVNNHLSLIMKTFKKTLKFSMFRDPCFLVSLASQVLFQFVVLYSMVFLIPLSMDKGFKPMDAALVQTVKSFAEITGRIGIPWLFKITNTNNIWTHIIINIANGFALVAHALVEDYRTFMVTAVVTGLLSGGIVVQGYHLILITMGKDRFSAAIGLCSFMHGIFLFFGGPLLGFLRDKTGTLVCSYLLLAAFQFTSGIVWVSRALTIRSNQKRRNDVRTDIIN